MEIFNRDYDGGESMQGFSRDIDEALDEVYNDKMKLLPIDRYGFFDGTLNVRITFEPNSLLDRTDQTNTEKGEVTQ